MPSPRTTRLALDALAAACLLGTVALVLGSPGPSGAVPLLPAGVGVITFVMSRTQPR
ncbi:hypothetical protein [Cellulomonas hominis]|uniref:hypothetical protein n=1 Tax=Cellulomonas hominis TaxID=156981 RepID=UPI001BA35B71|nr:hypothetical protein [Cellulomonas hominis]VTR75401.1 hypothetical protein CHMI_00145 [Cellulomonas hominis]